MKKALIIVDMQKDFCEGGSLAVNGGNSIVPIINKLKDEFIKSGGIVVASREMHPADHLSFASQNGKNPFDVSEDGTVFWPDHCVSGTNGATFHDDLDLSDVEIFTKGRDRVDHPFSAFGAIGEKSDFWLDDYLKGNEVTEVWVAGVATEFCVAATAMDAKANGYETFFISNAAKHITEQGRDEAINKMSEMGIKIYE